MKVFFVINSSNNGGAPKMIVTLYNEVAKQHPESRIIFLKRINSQYSEIENAFYLTEKLSSPIDYIKAFLKLYKLIKKEKPDSIISFLPLANIFSSIIGKKLGIKNRIASQRNPPHIYGKVVRLADKFLGSRNYYTENVCNSTAGMEAFDHYPESYKQKLSVINNCVEPANFSIDKNEAREILGIKKDTTVLTCVGRLHEQKNHDLLVRMMKHLENVHLYCAGDGPLHNQIINQIEKEEVKEKIILLGDLDRPKVQLLLIASDIFIIPSIYEGLSNSLLEAMSYGLPVVFSDITSFTKFLKIEDEDNYAGILVKGNDEKIWAQSVDSLIKDQELASNIRKKSLEKISTLTAEKMTQKFLNLLK